MTMSRRAVALTSFAISIATSVPVFAQTTADNPNSTLGLVFPVSIGLPTVHNGEPVKSGDEFYTQEIRSRSAIRLTADHVAHYTPHGLDGLDAKGEVTFPTGTLFVLARTRQGEMYCAARPESKDTWLTFHDVGLCVRDTDNDGKIDQEVVLNPTGWRQRIAYEMVGAGGGDWIPVTISSEPVSPADLPAITFHVGYLINPGGWLGGGKGFLTCGLHWPKSMIPEGVGDDTGKGAAAIEGVPRDARPIWPGDKGKISMGPVAVTYEALTDKSLKTEVSSGLPPGEASMFVVGRHYNVNNSKFQLVIVRIRPGNVLITAAEGKT